MFLSSPKEVGWIGPLPNGPSLWAYRLGVILTTYKSSDDPPSGNDFRVFESFLE